MPQKKSAAKALRKSDKNAEQNRNIRKQIKDIRKQAERAVQAKKADEARKLYQQLQKIVDKASRSGHFMSPNTASRYKSRLSKKISTVKT